MFAAIAICVACARPGPSEPAHRASPAVQSVASPSAPGPDGARGDASPRASGGLPTPVAAPSAQLDDPVFQAMLEVITRHRPAFRFRFQLDRLDGDWRLDGNADDGSGPGRLFIALTVTAGNLTANPCADADFTQGGQCVQQALPGGDRLVLRDLVDWDGIRTVVVTLIHADRSGLTAEAANLAVLGRAGPGGGRAIDARRELPLYSVAELAELVFAIDRRLKAVRSD
jgi:hypothetical protein